ncbi:peptidase C1-like family-domain-containing protein [Mycena olivaceomarginata]|nr:peptidase C1-like family-domain-containing protein [Mycena olivaceomarginata]
MPPTTLTNSSDQWDMVVNLVEGYGHVPQSIHPESTHSSLSGQLNSLLKTKLREHALILRRAHVNLRAQSFSPDAIVRALGLKKEDLMKEIYTVMTATIGIPAGPDEKFSCDYYNADVKPGHWEGTAKEFAKAFVSKPYSPTESFSLINDPRNEHSKLYTVDRLGNVVSGRPVFFYRATDVRSPTLLVIIGVSICSHGLSIDTAITLLFFALPGRPNNLLSHFDDGKDPQEWSRFTKIPEKVPRWPKLGNSTFLAAVRS